MPVLQIAEEIGRTEATIRTHFQGKTKAGQIVREKYEKTAREIKIRITLPELAPSEEIQRLKKEIEEETKKRQKSKAYWKRCTEH